MFEYATGHRQLLTCFVAAEMSGLSRSGHGERRSPPGLSFARIVPHTGREDI
jgi:hypothetical protein